MSSTPPATRADAVRNRERLLHVAADCFEQKGAAFSVDEVAALAGIGTGTFYRNFPTKSALLAALVAQQLDALATGTVDDGDAGAAVLRFVAEAIAGSRRKHDLVVALEAAGYATAEEISEASTRFRQRFGEVLTRAQAEGTIRADLGLEDLLALLSAATAAAARRGSSAAAVAAVIGDGLRPQPI
ncbi:TetR/AcrR family transcriptional regulator [Leifsonia poae]|uniref:TetR/AcrR family transcriptional regulator n=1 Tax=Leifsonia poae TaxID=110933 RepID=UPI001CBA6D90|nr:TetR/AcrR family transcriptional regulator [Leifsonia poae]